MIKYTVTINEEGREKTAYIEVKRPLTGDEPIIRTRLQALTELNEPEDEYWEAFKKMILTAQS